MPRSVRILVPGEFYHICHKGNYGQRIFVDTDDRVYYLKLFEEYKNKYGLDLYAFCLMQNHTHLIVRPRYANSMSQTMCRAHQRYAFYFNKKTQRQGHLWQERFYSCLLEGNHFAAAVRYVERNPVRAGIVDYPWDYSWSSAGAHTGKEYRIISLANLFEYVEVIDWKRFIALPDQENSLERIRKATATCGVMGSPEFAKDFQRNARGRPKINSAPHQLLMKVNK